MLFDHEHGVVNSCLMGSFILMVFWILFVAIVFHIFYEQKQAVREGIHAVPHHHPPWWWCPFGDNMDTGPITVIRCRPWKHKSIDFSGFQVGGEFESLLVENFWDHLYISWAEPSRAVLERARKRLGSFEVLFESHDLFEVDFNTLLLVSYTPLISLFIWNTKFVSQQSWCHTTMGHGSQQPLRSTCYSQLLNGFNNYSCYLQLHETSSGRNAIHPSAHVALTLIRTKNWCLYLAYLGLK